MKTSFALICLALSSSATAVAAGESVVYVSVAGEKRIAIYERSAETGGLTLLSSRGTVGEPGALAIGQDRKLLFASMRSTGKIASFRIEAGGGLVPLSLVAAGADPAHVQVDPTGRWLLAAYYQAGKVTVHEIRANGTLGETAHQTVTTDEKAHEIAFDPSGRFVFVPHTGPNAIYQFRFDPKSGRLTPNDPAKVQREAGTGPRHLSVHPRLPAAYSDNEQGSSVTMYAFDPKSGLLEPKQTLSTLPEGFVKPNSCARLELSPDGRFVYAANRGHDSIAGFAIDQETGRMTSIGQFATEATPRSFSISPDGKHVYAAGQSSGKLACYRRRGDGTLERFETLNIGSRPWWVLAVDLKTAE